MPEWLAGRFAGLRERASEYRLGFGQAAWTGRFGYPSTVGLAPKTKYMPWSNSGGPGFLGAAFAPFKPDEQGMANLKLNGIDLDRLHDRKQLLRNLDQLRRNFDANGVA